MSGKIADRIMDEPKFESKKKKILNKINGQV